MPEQGKIGALRYQANQQLAPTWDESPGLSTGFVNMLLEQSTYQLDAVYSRARRMISFSKVSRLLNVILRNIRIHSSRIRRSIGASSCGVGLHSVT